MLIDARTELLIQRCVDDELSAAETTALLRQLDGLADGWKCLACGLLEDRQLQRLLGNNPSGGSSIATIETVESVQVPLPLAVSAGTVAGQSAGSKSLRSWWAHPVTSLSLCAAIAFVGGLLIPDREAQGPPAGFAGTGAPSVGSPGTPQSAMLATDNSPQQFRIQVPQSGQELDVPVYSGVDQLVRDNRQHPLFSGRMRNGEAQDGVVQWMVAPMDGDRFVVIPVTEDVVGRIQ
jgi:hypothetical protein